jgi:methylated-DNA-[protein]-cysteine S-methyltransferase
MAKSTATHYCIFPTALGPMAALSNTAGLCRVILPHYQRDDLDALIPWEHPGAVATRGPFEPFIEQARVYFNGAVPDFADIPLDLPGETTFTGKVYRACRQIPHGTTVSYRELSLSIGREDAAHAVAAAMGKNALPLIVPCHRVIYASGKLGGFSAEGGTPLKQKMLDLERRARDT